MSTKTERRAAAEIQRDLDALRERYEAAVQLLRGPFAEQTYALDECEVEFEVGQRVHLRRIMRSPQLQETEG